MSPKQPRQWTAAMRKIMGLAWVVVNGRAATHDGIGLAELTESAVGASDMGPPVVPPLARFLSWFLWKRADLLELTQPRT